LAGAALPCGATPTFAIPQITTSRLKLSSGRWLSYSECGDPAGRLVFYFHGTPGSRLEVRLIEAEAYQAGIRLVAIDRPGLGGSTHYPSRQIVHWPADVEQLAAALGYAEAPYGILAMSGGAPYATA